MSRIRKVRGQNIDIALEEADIISINHENTPTPVKTGNLRDNFRIDSRGRVVNPTSYGDMIERGTAKIRPYFMVATSIPTIARRLERKVGKQIDEAKLLDLPKKR